MFKVSKFLEFPSEATIGLSRKNNKLKLRVLDQNSSDATQESSITPDKRSGLTTSWMGYFCWWRKREQKQLDVIGQFRQALLVDYADIYRDPIAATALERRIGAVSGSSIRGSKVRQIVEKAEKLRLKATRKKITYLDRETDTSLLALKQRYLANLNKQSPQSGPTPKTLTTPEFGIESNPLIELYEKTLPLPDFGAPPLATKKSLCASTSPAVKPPGQKDVQYSASQGVHSNCRYPRLLAIAKAYLDSPISQAIPNYEVYADSCHEEIPAQLDWIKAEENALRMVEELAALPFKECTTGRHFFQPNSRIVLARIDGVATLKALESPDDPLAYTEQIKQANQATHRAFKIFVAYHYGISVARELWEYKPNLRTLFECGDSLRQDQIKEILEQAEELQLSYEVAARASRWSAGRTPPARESQWFNSEEARCHVPFFDRFQDNRWSLLEKTMRLVPKGVDASRLGKDTSAKAEPIENQLAILSFMDYLEYNHIHPSICAYVWRTYFDQAFVDGSPLTGDAVARIFKEALALNTVHEYALTLDKADQDFQQRIAPPSGRDLRPNGYSLEMLAPYTKRAHSTASRWKVFLNRVFLGEKNSVPINEKQVRKNRVFILTLSEYIAFHYGKNIAEEFWNSTLRNPYTMGIRIGSDAILTILKEAQDKSQQRYTVAEEAVRTFSATYLRNTKSVRKTLGTKIDADLDSNLVIKLRANFEAKALAWIRSHEIRSDLEIQVTLRDIFHQCYAKLSVETMAEFGWISDAKTLKKAKRKELYDHFCIESPLFNSEVAKRIAKVESISNTAHPSFSRNLWDGITVENASNLLHILRNGGNLSKYALGTHYLGVDKWARLYQLTLSPEERLAYYKEHPHMITSEPQLVGVLGSVLGATAEFLNLIRTIRADASKQHNIHLLTQRYRAAMYLSEHLLRAYAPDGSFTLDLPPGVSLPTKEELQKLHDELKADVEASSEVLGAASAAYQKDPISSGVYRWRHPANMALSLTAATISGAFVSSVCPQQLGWWDRDQLTLEISNFASDAFSVPVLPLNAFDIYTEYKAFRHSHATKKRAKEVLEELHQNSAGLVDEAHQKYRRYKATHTWYARVALRALAHAPQWQNWLQQKLEPAKTAKQSRSGAIEVDIAKSIYRAQNSGTHLFNFGAHVFRSGASIFCITSSFVMVFGEHGTLIGAVVATPLIPGVGTIIGTVLGGIASASIGLGLGLTAFLGRKLYTYFAEKKRKERLQQLIDAYVHDDGPISQQMKAAGLSRPQRAKLAYRKLIRQNANLAIKKMAIRLQKEQRAYQAYLDNLRQQPSSTNIKEPTQIATQMLEKLAQPHKETDAEKSQTKYMENNQSKALIAELRKMKIAAPLESRLSTLLIPA